MYLNTTYHAATYDLTNFKYRTFFPFSFMINSSYDRSIDTITSTYSSTNLLYRISSIKALIYAPATSATATFQPSHVSTIAVNNTELVYAVDKIISIFYLYPHCFLPLVHTLPLIFMLCFTFYTDIGCSNLLLSSCVILLVCTRTKVFRQYN